MQLTDRIVEQLANQIQNLACCKKLLAASKKELLNQLIGLSDLIAELECMENQLAHAQYLKCTNLKKDIAVSKELIAIRKRNITFLKLFIAHLEAMIPLLKARIAHSKNKLVSAM